MHGHLNVKISEDLGKMFHFLIKQFISALMRTRCTVRGAFDGPEIWEAFSVSVIILLRPLDRDGLYLRKTKEIPNEIPRQN